jgi:hypothetical protein
MLDGFFLEKPAGGHTPLKAGEPQQWCGTRQSFFPDLYRGAPILRRFYNADALKVGVFSEMFIYAAIANPAPGHAAHFGDRGPDMRE